MDKLNRIVIVIPNGELVVSSIAGTFKLFQSAIAGHSSKAELIVAGERKNHRYFDGLFTVTPHLDWRKIRKADLIIVPAIKDQISKVLNENKLLMNWLVKQYNKGSHIASLCTGSFLLAEAGLLENKRCTTHWAFTDEFKNRYRNTRFTKNNIITEDDRVFTSGGAYTFLNLIVYLVERFFSKDTARHLISNYLIDYNRINQDPFVVFSSQKNHNDDGIRKVQEYLEKHYHLKVSNEALASEANLGTRTMVRRFKTLCGNTPNEYLQRVRIEAAKDLLSISGKTINEIQFSVGYNDPKTFRNFFLRYTGCSPAEYRRKYKISR